MYRFDEVKNAVLVHFQRCMPKCVEAMQKLVDNQEISLDEVDDLIERLGKYHAHVICLRSFAK